jgi:hypothetical protein
MVHHNLPGNDGQPVPFFMHPTTTFQELTLFIIALMGLEAQQQMTWLTLIENGQIINPPAVQSKHLYGKHSQKKEQLLVRSYRPQSMSNA